jgi:uridine phosphorylase
MSPVRAGRETVLPLTRIPVAQLAPNVVVVGDPERVRAVGERLEGAAVIASNREYLSIGGTHRGVPVTVVSHGVGGPGAGVAFEELCRGGARRIVRAGTAGGLQPAVGDGAVVVVTAAVREDGLTDLLVPAGYPAVADARLTTALEDAARAAGVDAERLHRGVVHSNAAFYSHEVLGSRLELWQRAGCVAVEMEAAPLFVIAGLHGVAAGAILAVDGNPLAAGDTAMEGYDPFRQVVRDAVDAVVTAALEAVTAPSPAT